MAITVAARVIGAAQTATDWPVTDSFNASISSLFTFDNLPSGGPWVMYAVEVKTRVPTKPAKIDPRDVIGADDGLLPALGRLLTDAAALLYTDREAAKGCIVEASALLSAACGPSEVPLAVIDARHVLAPWLARRLREHIETNLETSIRIGDLAGFAGLSASYFFRAFKGSFGMPPHAYVLSRRLERARRMLLSTNEPICQIALACGLSDQAHFSRLFHRQTGQPPGVWRRQRRGGVVFPYQAAE